MYIFQFRSTFLNSANYNFGDLHLSSKIRIGMFSISHIVDCIFFRSCWSYAAFFYQKKVFLFHLGVIKLVSILSKSCYVDPFKFFVGQIASNISDGGPNLFWEDCEEKIDMVALASKEPILFYDEVNDLCSGYNWGQFDVSYIFNLVNLCLSQLVHHLLYVAPCRCCLNF